MAVTAAACSSEGPADKPAAARPTTAPAAAAPAARPEITDFEPKVGKAAWARETWRHPGENCRDRPGGHPADLKIEPPGSSGRGSLRWVESCDFTEPDLQVTLHGSGFSTNRVRNSVFFAGVRAFVARADANTLVVQPLGNAPGPARISVRTSGEDVDDASAADHAEAAELFHFLGPPVRVSAVEGDGQVVGLEGALGRVAVRVTDLNDQGLPGERVWFWAVPEAGGPWPRPPIRVEAVTEMLGIAKATFTVADTPGSFRILAEVVNTAPDRDPIAPATFREIVMGPNADLDKLVDEVSRGDPEARARAARALAGFRAGAAPATAALITATHDQSETLRRAAADTLIQIGTPAALDAAVEVEIGELRPDEADRYRDAAARLGRMGAAARRAVPVLATGLKTRRPYGGSTAMDALKELGPNAAEAVPALVDVLLGRGLPVPRDHVAEMSQTDFRRDAAYVLGAIGLPGAASAIPAIKEALRDPRFEIQAAAESVLNKTFGGVPPLTLTLVSPDKGASFRPPLGRGGLGEVGVRVTDAQGHGAPYETVTFLDDNGCVALRSERVQTDQDGLAKVSFTVMCPSSFGVSAHVRGLSTVASFR